MKISELIKELEACMERFGDMEVRTAYDGWVTPTDSIEILESQDGSHYLEIF